MAPATLHLGPLLRYADSHTAEAHSPAHPSGSRLLRLTCSPIHNTVPSYMRLAFRIAWSAPGRLLGRALSRHGPVPAPRITWRRTGGPWFGNQLMTLTLRGHAARLRLDQARGPGFRTPLDAGLTGE
jgi:hypothetical protein